MNRDLRILKWSLLAGSFYFLAVSAVHMLGVKVALLFVYFNVPSNPYQDRIISFLAFGWAVFLFTASTDPRKQSALVRAILVAGAGAVAGLSVINFATDFHALGRAIDARIFWIETLGLFAYWLWLVVFYFRSARQ
jgi:hypothetical protein